MTAEIQAVLFDLDGTLINSEPAVYRAWLELGHAAGFSIENMLQGLHGVPARQSLARLLGPARASELDHWTDWLLQAECADTVGVELLPGAIELVEQIEASGMPWGIVTSCQLPLAQARLSAVGLRLPEILVTADDVKIGKPDPAPYLLGASLAQLPNAAALVVEDAPAGVTAGKQAGSPVWAITTTHVAAELGQADQVFADLFELSQALFS